MNLRACREWVGLCGARGLRALLGRRRRGASVLAVGVLVALGAGPARAAQLTVNTTTDEENAGDGMCSLREAITAVNSPGTASDCGVADFGANTIVLGAKTYVLSLFGFPGGDNTSGDLNVTATNLTMRGSGVATTKIDASGFPASYSDRVLSVASGATVTIADLTLTGGHAPDGAPGSDGGNDLGSNNEGCSGDCGGDGGSGGAGANGGGVENAGTLTLMDAAVTDSRAGNGGVGGDAGVGDEGGVGGVGGRAGAGGGIYNTGTLTLVGTVIGGNRGGIGGGGGGGGFSYNTTGPAGGNGAGLGDGGGIYNDGGSLTITGSTIVDNFAGDGGTGGYGGATGLPGDSGGKGGVGGTASWGGGVVSIGGSLSVTNSTFAANHGGSGGEGGAGGDYDGPSPGGPGGPGGNGGGGGAGGGVVTSGSSALLLNTTFANNVVGSAGQGGPGGIGTYATGSGSPGSTGASAAGGGIFTPTVFCVIGHPCPATTVQNTIVASSSGGNCSGPITDGGHNLSFGDTSCPGVNGDPKLGSLADYGGPTPTIPLLAGSAAADQVPATGAGCPASDQRGVSRPEPSGGKCDIGAYELAPPALTTAAASAVTSTGATVGGTVNPNLRDASFRIEYGTTTAYGSQTETQDAGSGNGPVALTAGVSGLAPATTYHYRAVATNGDGTSDGPDRTFTTLPNSPSLSVSAPSSGTAGNAVTASAVSASLTGGGSPSGTITFKVIGPQANAPSDCTGAATVGTASVSGNGAYHPSAAFTPPVAGEYWWYASYAGDSSNSQAQSPCGASMANTEVMPATLSRLGLSPRKFSLGGRQVNGKCVRPTRKNKHDKRCTRPAELKIGYTLDANAIVAFTLTKNAPGRQVKGACVKPTRKNTMHKRCTRSMAIPGKLVEAGTPGANNFIITGKVGGHQLPLGSYRLTATVPGGSRQTVSFRIVP